MSHGRSGNEGIAGILIRKTCLRVGKVEVMFESEVW